MEPLELVAAHPAPDASLFSSSSLLTAVCSYATKAVRSAAVVASSSCSDDVEEATTSPRNSRADENLATRVGSASTDALIPGEGPKRSGASNITMLSKT